MKEHLNVGTIANPAGWMDNHKITENREPQPGTRPGAQEDTLLSDRDDVFAGSVPVGQLDESLIEGMDFEAALESLDFIRRQAGSAKGRRDMGLAHREISPQKVMELLG